MTGVPDRLNAALEGRYTIERELGAGGMATVYLAQDLKHDRKVALKVLKPELAAVVGAERFLAEIRTTANLQHPHILPLHDSGEVDGTVFFVMPFIEGETLRDRLTREKQLPIDEAVRIGTEVASALDYAHRHAVIHRDIKPENILLHEGQALVADFGIALAASATGGTRMTETGMSLGTPTYMSPEQALGERTLDARSDVYSLGCVVYEMLVGDPPHTGSTAQAILAKVVTDQPRPPAELRATVPAHVESAVLAALAKLPADRFATAASFSAALTGAARVGPPGTAVESGRARPTARARWLPWTLAAASLAAAVWLGLRTPRHAAEAGWHLNVTLPDTVPLVFLGEATGGIGQTALAVSRDGRYLAYVGPADSTTRLYLRDLRTAETRRLAGTEGAYAPFFSPDGEWVAFFAGQQLKRASVDGGQVLPIAEANWTYNGAWGEDDRIAVAASDGRAVGIATPTSGRLAFVEFDGSWPGRIAHPQWLPGGEWLLLLCYAPNHLCALSTRTGEVRHLVVNGPAVPGNESTAAWLAGVNPRFIEPDLLVYSAAADNVVMGVRFDPERLEIIGAPVPVVTGVRREDPLGALQLAASAAGDLVYARGANRGQSTFGWVDRGGHVEPLPFPARVYGGFRLSPDGRFIVTRVLPQVGDSEMWFLDLRRPDEGRRWTPSSVPADITVGLGAWEPDGQAVLLNADRSGANYIIRVNAVRAGDAVLWSGSDNLAVYQVGPGGNAFVSLWSTAAGEQLGVMRLADLANVSPGAAGALEPVAKGMGPLSSVSPDFGWITFTSSVSGPYEVWARRLTGNESPMRISSGGGELPRWAPDGSGFWYRNGQRWYWVERTGARDEPFAAPRFVLRGDFLQVAGPEYEVSPDGERLLVLLGSGSATTTTLDIITNWRAGVVRRLRESSRP